MFQPGKLECFSSRYTAAVHGVPFVCAKSITDIVGRETGHHDFHANLASSMAALARVAPAIVHATAAALL